MNQVLERVEHAVASGPVVESTIVVDGFQVRLRRAGSGPALVMIHGLCGSGRNWAKNIEPLAQLRTVYAIDLLNAGGSERVRGLDASLAAHADRVARTMDTLGIDAADMIGHSHGAAIAMVLAARHPGRVSRLVLFAPANPYCTLGRRQMRFYATPLGREFARFVIPRVPRILHLRSLERMYGDKGRIGPGVLEGYTGGLNTRAIEHILAIMLRWGGDMDALEAILPQIKHIPTLIFWGDLDRAVALDSGRRLAETLGAPLEIVPGAGHIAFEEMPEICNPIIANWLRG